MSGVVERGSWECVLFLCGTFFLRTGEFCYSRMGGKVFTDTRTDR